MSVIRANYVFLLETLDVKLSGLVDQLYCDQVVSERERGDINAEQTSFRANEQLLSVLSRKSPQQFQQFLDVLDKCGQQHIRDVISGRRGLFVKAIHFAYTQMSRPSILACCLLPNVAISLQSSATVMICCLSVVRRLFVSRLLRKLFLIIKRKY